MMFIETHVCGKWQTSIELQSSKEKQIGRIKDKEDKRKNKRAFMNYNLLGKQKLVFAGSVYLGLNLQDVLSFTIL